MKNRFKKLAIICIAFIGISLVATAAVNLYAPRAEIVSGTNNKEGAVFLVFNYVNADYLKLYDFTAGEYRLLWETSVDYSHEEQLCSVTLLNYLSPGLYTLKVVAGIIDGQVETISDPFYIYVNAVEP